MTRTININGSIKDYSAVVEYDIEVERNYGADADGNRGQYAEFIEGFRIIFVYNDKGVDIMNRIPEATMQKIHDDCLEFVRHD